ncbi:bifunctional isocitrate dehydrogenase kinase/phosphatase [Neisseria sp. Ec49-e6-T10]|uniref:bifunctional isocitrate dehydrogenase kinase/phosphatase n=1 Tax=Neisseria sp. Ec49-e6-T10 TaxID=3140744 RepID=UPI003EBA5D16
MELKAQQLAQLILEGFNRHFKIFTEYNKKAALYFAQSRFQEANEAAKYQVGLYDVRVNECVEKIKETCQITQLDKPLWQKVKIAYMHKLYEHLQPELAESFYNSLFCRLFNRHYYHNQYIFFNPAINTQNIQTECPDYRSYYPTQYGLDVEVKRLLLDIPIELPFEDLNRDTQHIVQAIEQYQTGITNLSHNFQIHIAFPVFYRNKGAYLVGRIINHATVYPFIIPLLNKNGQLFVDAFLSNEQDISNVFSFARAYFKADFPVPSALIRFLQTVLPNKKLADLYTAIGFHKQGKNEFYRAFCYHLRHSSDEFIIAPGIEGMVMHVFTLPSYPYVFKIIKDQFHINKNITHKMVKQRYQMVKQLDRVGRMADTWEFSYVAFPLARFSAECLQQLENNCHSNISIEDDCLIIKHMYIERRMTPLNIYMTQANETEKTRVLQDYGLAIKEIAAAGVFPGDLLMKNFGVTRHGRVVFYDYDEIVPIEDCCFRDIPPAQTMEQELSAEPWYYVGEHDVFPEEFEYYLVSDPTLKKQFKQYYPELMQSQFWQKMQKMHEQGILADVFPYSLNKRFTIEHSVTSN